MTNFCGKGRKVKRNGEKKRASQKAEFFTAIFEKEKKRKRRKKRETKKALEKDSLRGML